MLSNENNKNEEVKYTDYRISTITAIGNINSVINLQLFFELFNINDRFVYVEYGKTKNISNSKGEHPKKKKTNKKKKRTNRRKSNKCKTNRRK